MRNSLPFLAAVFACGIALGLGGGLLVSGRGGSQDDQIFPAPGPAPDGDAAKNAAPAPAPAPDAPSGKAPGTGAAAGDSEALIKALMSIGTPSYDKGSGSITGTVATASGKPVQGALIRASRADKSSGWSLKPSDGSAPEDEDLETRVRDLVRTYRMENTTRREASTDAAGRFTLTGLADCEYQVWAYKKGCEFQRKNPTKKGTARRGDVVDFVASALVEVRISVILPDGAIAEKAEIETRQKGSREKWQYAPTYAWRKDKPCIYLKPGGYVLIAEAEEHGGLRSAEQEVRVEEGAVPSEARLMLKEPVGIRGRLEFPEGMDTKQLWMRYMQVPESSAPNPADLMRKGKYLMMPQDGTRTFEIKDLAPGTYLVGVATMSFRVIAHCMVQVTDRMAEAVLSPAPLKPEEYLVVRVYDPSGGLTTEVTFEIGFTSEQYSTSGPATWIRQKDGSFWVLNYASDAERMPRPKDSRNTIKVISEKFGFKQAEYDPAATRELTFSFRSPSMLEVTIGGYKGSDLAGSLSFSVMHADGKDDENVSSYGRDDGQKILDAEGRTTLGPFEPGEYVLIMILGTADAGRSAIPIRKTAVTLAAGANAVTVGIPPLYQLTITFEKAGKGESVIVGQASSKRRWGGWHLQKEIGEDGKAVFNRLPEGAYRIQKWGGADAGSMEITLPGQSSVTFKPKPVNALLVTVSNPSGLLGSAGLQTGDMIIGMDGTEFKNLAHMQMLLYASMGKEKTSLMIVRGGASMSVEVETAKLFNPGSESQMGGDVEEVSRE